MKKWIGDLAISRKILFGFIITVIIAVCVGVAGVVCINKINRNAELLYEENTVGLGFLGSAYGDFNNLRYTSLEFSNAVEGAEKDGYRAAMDELLNNIDGLLAKYESVYGASGVSNQYTETKALWTQYKSGIKRAEAAGAIDKETSGAGNSLEDGFSRLMETDAPAAEKRHVRSGEIVRNSTVIVAAELLAGAVISIVIAVCISNMISLPMQKFAMFAGLMAQGDIDLGKYVDDNYRKVFSRKDEVGVVARAFNAVVLGIVDETRKIRAIADGDFTTEVTVRSEKDVMGIALNELVEKFRSLAASIVASADEVNQSSKLVANSSSSLSQGATEQASSIEELTATLGEMSAQTEQNTRSARSASLLSEKVRREAAAGSGKMSEMLRAMEEVNGSSVNIEKINKVIEDIAFQTNILALNAAVEAARAGEHGKGFAVVANEVKTLAGKSADAAKETTELIEKSIKKVEAGSKIADETAASLREIVGGVEESAGLISSIAEASDKQLQAIELVNQSITQVSQVVQSNAAMSEEVAAASEELSGQADALRENVSVFRIHRSPEGM